MLSNYREFKAQHDNKLINFKYNCFNEVIYAFKILQILTSDYINQNIIQDIDESNIIVIDTYETSYSKYYIACFKKYLIMFDQLDKRLTNHMLSEKNKRKIIYIPKVQDNSSINIFWDEISKFNERFIIISQNKYIITFWKVIQSCLSGYLIKKCYIDCNKDRLKKFKDTKIESKKFKEFEFIYLRRIGATQSTEVHLCYHIITGKFYAVKIFKDDRDNEKSKNREIRNYQTINYPFIPEYFGLTTKDCNDSIVIEYIDGTVLDNKTILQLTFDEKVTINLEFLHTIQYLHKNNYIYRDFKLNNLMLDKFKRIVILDFDRMIDSNQDGEFTNDFLSPFVDEKLNIKGYIPKPKNDIFSIGKIINFFFIENNNNNNKTIIDKIKTEICDKCSSENLDERPSVQFLIDYFCTIIIENGIFSNNLLNDFIFYAKQNNPLALTYLGIIYLNGEHVEKDIDKSIHYFTLASDLDEFHAQFNLGQIYFEKEFNRYDIDKAIHYYKLSASKDKYAQAKLGLILFENKKINEAIHYLSLAAKQNIPIAQANLGFLYFEGKKINRDINKAIYYLSSAAKNNDVLAQTTLGLIYSKGEYIERDINKAIYYFKLASDQKHSNAQFNLGQIYLEGKFIKRDINQSIHYFQLAANQGHTKALFYLGTIYYEGKYIKKDVNKAVNYFTIASNLNDKCSQNALGSIYIEGKYVMQDINKAIYLLSLSARQNFAPAQNNLGFIFFESKYVRRDMNKAIHFLTLAANQNYPLALRNLGIIYLKGEYVKRNVDFAMNCLTNAANQNFVNAQNDLGYVYYEGKFVNRDIDKAISYFQLAANQNYLQAQNDLGFIYYEGKYVTRDINKAIHYLTLAADQNFVLAQDNLGFIYSAGKYMKKDINKSIHYFTLAANQGFPKAHVSLGMLYLEGKDVKRDIDKAIYHLTIASNCNISFAQNNLGFIYYEGLFIPKDINKAIHYFTFAANHNNSCAQYNLGFIYYEGKSVARDIKKSLFYLELSSKNNFRPAQLLLADLHFEGKNIKRNIDEAIRLYKEVSSFDNKFAKNNLGVIYLKYKNNFSMAKEYFKDAVNKKSDFLSMYNLANILIDEEEKLGKDYDESIKYLLLSSNKFQPSLMLFCLLIFKKHKYIDFELIKKEIKKHDLDINLINEFKINENFLLNQQYLNTLFTDEMYQYYRKSFFIYINKKVVNFSELFEYDSQKINEVHSTENNITNQFYEGFNE